MSYGAYILVTVITCLILSCKQSDEAEQMKQATAMIPELNSSDTFYSSVPNEWKHPSVKSNEAQFRKDLNIPDLAKGSDSFCIKIVYGCSPFRITTIVNYKGKWSAEISTTSSAARDESDPAFAKFEFKHTRAIRQEQPKSGWKVFIQKLFDLDILTLPIEDSILRREKSAATDGCGAAVEIASRNYYRGYSYINFGEGSNNKAENNLSQILGFIDREFSLFQMWGYAANGTGEIPNWLNEHKRWGPYEPSTKRGVKLQEVTIDTTPP